MAIFNSYVSLPEGKHGCFPQLDDQRVPVRRHALDALDALDNGSRGPYRNRYLMDSHVEIVDHEQHSDFMDVPVSWMDDMDGLMVFSSSFCCFCW